MEVFWQGFLFCFLSGLHACCTLVWAFYTISNNFGLKGSGFEGRSEKVGLDKGKDSFCVYKVPPNSWKLNEYDIVDFHSPNIPVTFEPKP